MKKIFLLPIYVFVLLLMKTGSGYSQCSGCTITYATNTPANITISSGQTVCVNSGVTLSGQVFLNGGVLCNSGTIVNLRLNGGRGIIKNYKNMYDIESGITFGGNVYIYCYNGSLLDIQPNSFSFTSGTDSLFFCNYAGARVSFQSDLPINGKTLAFYNGMTDPANPTVTSTAYFDVGGDMSINGAELKLYNSSLGEITTAGSVNFSNARSKTINNFGYLNIAGDVTTAGTGASGTAVLIQNSKQIDIGGSLSTNISSATFNMNNNINTVPGITIGADLLLSAGTQNFSNQGKLVVNNDLSLITGTLTNSDTIKVTGNFSLTSVFQNYHVSKSSDLVVHSGALLDNNGAIDLSDDFINNGKVRLKYKSLLKTVDYYNNGSDSIIGVNPAGLDLGEYPRIWIKSHSENGGPLQKGILISDESLVTNTLSNGTGFDWTPNPSIVGTDVNWVTVATNVSVIKNPVKAQKYYLWAVASTYNLPCGAPNSVTLTANPGIPYFSHYLGNGLYYLETVTYVWNPGGLTGQSVVVNPTATTTYTVSFTNSMASYVYEVTVNVAVVSLSCSGPTVNFAMPDVLNLTGTPSGGTAPYTYQWSPNAFFTNGTSVTSQNPQVKPSTSICYTLTATDSYGCHATCEVCVIAQPYAHFNKIPDGGYYKLFNNKLLFKYDGQYAETNLNCAIYDKTNSPITSGSFSSIIVNSGDNRYYYDANSLSVGYYTMVVTNEKNEKLYLRFKR